MNLKIAVLASGGGTNLQALIDAWKANQLHGSEISLVISDRAEAGALKRAAAAEIQTLLLDPQNVPDREAYDRVLLQELNRFDIGLVCLAGYLRILTPVVIQSYRLKIMNMHPALLPAFGGQGMYGHRVHEAVLASGAKYSGCTVHFVDEGTDTGPIILQKVVPVLDQDTPETLAERVLIEEHRLYPRAVELFCEGRLQVKGKRVHILERA